MTGLALAVAAAVQTVTLTPQARKRAPLNRSSRYSQTWRVLVGYAPFANH